MRLIFVIDVPNACATCAQVRPDLLPILPQLDRNSALADWYTWSSSHVYYIGICHRVTVGANGLLGPAAPSDRYGMKHVWRVQGTFFDWEMTVKVRPAEKPPMPITESDQGSAIARMKRVGEHFHDTVSLHEYSLELNDLR